MQNKYLVFGTLSKSILGGFQKNNVDADAYPGKAFFYRLYALAFLMLTQFGYSQLATEYFESGIPLTWAVASNLAPAPTNNWTPTPAGGYLATGGAVVNPALNNTQGTSAEYFLITKQFLTPANGQIRFFTKQGSFQNRGTIYQVRISLANQPDLASFSVTLDSWTELQLNSAATTYEEKVVALPNLAVGTPVYIAFVAITNQTSSTTTTSGDSWFVDNARVVTACPVVTPPIIDASSDSVNISWTHPTTNSFGVEIVLPPASHGTTGIPVTGTTYTQGNLLPGTTYNFYIRANCDNDVPSAWAGPFSFTTDAVGLTCPTAIVIPDVSTAPYQLISNLDQYYTTTDYTDYTTIGSNCFPPEQFPQNQLAGNHLFFNYTPAISGVINIKQVITTGGGPNNCWNDQTSVMVFNSCADVGVSCLAAMTTGPNQHVNQISDLYVVGGHTYVIVMSSLFPHAENSNAGICFNFTVTGATCPSPSPSGTSYSDLTQTGANFSWSNAGGIMDTWNYVALPVNAGLPTTTYSTTTNPLGNPVSGLTAGTTYNFYVRSVCEEGNGNWSAPFQFTTPCNAYTPPYNTGFTETDTSLTCWSQLNMNNDTNFFTFGNSAYSEPVAKLRTSSPPNDMLISPQFHLDGITQKRLRFKYSIYGNWGPSVNPTPGPGSFEVKYSDSGIGAQNFTHTIIPLASYSPGYDFIEVIVPLPNIEEDIHIAWILPEFSTQTGIQFYVDDVYVEDMPACSEPAYPVITPGSITANSAEVSWTPGYGNTQWELVAQPLGTGVPTAPGIIVSTNPYTLDLDPSTRYEFYIRAYCSDVEQSIWVGPLNFNTLCIAQPTPYYESLNDVDNTTKKFCWSTNNVDGDPAQWRISETEAAIAPQGTFITPFSSFNDWLISAPVNAVGPKIVRFQKRVLSTPFFPSPRGNFEVIMSPTADFSTYTVLIPAHDFTNSAFEEDSAIFNGTGVTYFAFRLPPTMVDPLNTGYVMVDDFVVEDAPACPAPADLTASNITQNTATLGWTAGFNEIKWQIVVQTAGSGIPTGSGTTVDITPTYNALGLPQDTLHEFYVKAVCNGTESSEWVGPFTFKTTCDPLPTPFLETFDTTSMTESCWTTVNANADGNFWNLNQTVNPIGGDQMSALFTGTNGNNNDWLITPTLSAHAGQRLRFSYKVYNAFFEEDLKVMLSIGGVDTSVFSRLYQNNLSTTTDAIGTVEGLNKITVASTEDIRVGDVMYIPGFPFPYLTTVTNVNQTTFEITLSENATISQPGVQHVEFKHETINNVEAREMVINLVDITTDKNINIGFHTPTYPANPWNYRGQFTFIDNVIIEDIPACPSVINVTSTDILDTSVIVNWESTGSEGTWEISVQPYGTPAPVGDILTDYLYTTASHPFTVTELTPGTQYQYYVRAVCSDSSQSTWVGPFEVITKCDYANVCMYTITVTNGNTGQVTQHVNLMQNGVVVQEINFPGFGQESLDYQVFLCSGVAFDLYWEGMGSGLQYYEAQMTVKDEAENIIWTSPLGLGTVNTNIYSGYASCGVITCPQPTDLTVSNQGVFSWTPGDLETKWEVFVQPYHNGTLPQSGTTVITTPNYTPVADDFTDATAGTYEYFVRAVCGDDDKSFWSGPYVFIRNDEPANAVHLTPNTGTTCDVSGVDASFIRATPSTTPTACGGVNGGDIWYDFVATAKVHTIELSHFGPGSYYESSFEGQWPKIMMSLYKQEGAVLTELGCSDNNSFVAMYSSELEVGVTYKIRLKLDSMVPNSDKLFHICITTPDPCDMNAFNYDFEKPPMQAVTGVSTIINATVVPGWRLNTEWGAIFFQEGSNSLGELAPYSGGQLVQLLHDDQSEWDPNSPDIEGLYKDFDTSEIPVMDYSFASASRVSSGDGTTVQLFAGPPAGPFTLVTEDAANSVNWELVTGTYTVPAGQTTTRFIFRVKEYAIGHVLDAANFVANTDINIDSADTTLDCTTTSMDFNATGIGQWQADESNPAVTTIATPNTGATNVTGFTAPGSYVFHWVSRYCDKTITITKQGTLEVPVVENPTIYCLNDVATPLVATVPSGFTVNWYTQPVGGVATTVAPTPSTAVAGNSQVFYATALDASGCEGIRTEIVVQVNDLPTAAITGTTTICEGTTATITFVGTPNTTVTYTVNGGSPETIALDTTGLATLTTPTLTANATYELVNVSLTGTNACTQPLTGNAVVTTEVLPTVAISGSTTICEGQTATITFNGTANATVTYTVDGGTNQTIALNGTGAATITTPVLTTSSTYTLVSVTSPGALACNQAQTGSAIVTVEALPTATISGTVSICSGATAVITFNGTPNATVTYSVDGGVSQTITLDATGVATLTTPVLSVNSNYDLVGVNSATCSQTVSGSAVVTVGSLPTAAISGTTAVCLNAANPEIIFTGANGAAPYTFTYTLNGGAAQTITTSTGNSVSISVPTSAAGVFTYDLTSVSSASLASCSQAQTGSATVTVEALPTAAISGTTTICTGSTAVITFNGTPNATVTYTVDGGTNQTIILNASGSATITTAALTANTTFVLLSATSATVTACSQSLTGSAVITVNQLTVPNVTFSYAQACINATANPLPILTSGFVTGGVFGSSSITVDPATGAVNLATATIGSHQVTYTLLANPGACTDGGVYTANISISTGITPVTDFSYATSYCANATNDLPTTASGFTSGGTFSATPGLSINTTTGEIDFGNSTSGDHTITYTVAVDAAACNIGGTSTFDIALAPELTFVIDKNCEDSMLILEIIEPNFTVGTVNWMQGTTTVGTGETFNVDEYMAENPTLILPLTFTAVTTSGGCDAMQSTTVENNPCRVIPKGISPNGDDLNDTFDLIGYGVKDIIIFNRYGTEVFSYSGNYTNQWEGQTNGGDKLPDATYFYSIHTNDGATKTGWVYINREY
jgi:gliding motility-associated-like protein